jgi:hypothetical protein
MPAPASHDEERHSYTEFACQHGLPAYRWRLADLYVARHRFNETYCGGRLLAPHLSLDRTAPRSFGHCATTTGYGGKIQLTLNDGLVFGTKRDWVVRPWPPAQGTGRFIEDMLLRLTVRHFVMEFVRADESSYGGFGPFFVKQANLIGAALGLRPVVERRRGAGDDRPVAAAWPHCVRRADYYGTDLTEEALELAGCQSSGRRRQAPATPSRGLLELIHYLWQADRDDEVRRLVERHLGWSAVLVRSNWPLRRSVEAGREDLDGSALGEVPVRPEWLRWNGGTVRRIAEELDRSGSYADLPLLAAALVVAGCDDGRILRHLRAEIQHDRRCWAVRLLLAAADD